MLTHMISSNERYSPDPYKSNESLILDRGKHAAAKQKSRNVGMSSAATHEVLKGGGNSEKLTVR